MQLLELWDTSYKDLRMVDTKQFQSMKDPMELSRFQHICMNHIDAAKEKLLKQWVRLMTFNGKFVVNFPIKN